MNYHAKLTALGIHLTRSTGQVKTRCPQCSETRKKKNDPCLSVNIDEGTYHCHNCGWKGGVSAREAKVYFKPIFNENHTNLPDKVVDWFKGRKIRQETCLFWKIGYESVWMPQTGKEERVISFNYFSGGELVNVKYRDGRKNFRMVKDAKLVFYGLDTITDYTQPVVICEGEMDALTLWQCGHKQVLSVPNGATKGGNLEYIDNCYDILEKCQYFVIWTDTDEPGQMLRAELVRRLGDDRCKIVNSRWKDANECLMEAGETEVNAQVQGAKDAKISGVIYVGDCVDELGTLYDNGLPPGDAIGVPEFDKLLTFEHMRLTTVTGIPSHGKSEFIDFILAKLMLRHGWKVAYYSPENYPRSLHISKMIEKIVGKAFRGNNRMTRGEMANCSEYLEERLFFINPEDEDFSLDSILTHCKKLVRKYGLRAIVIDPWNKLDHTIPNGMNETTYISKQLDKLTKFAQVNLCHVFLIAHPTKMRKMDNGKYDVPTLYDIAGSAHFFNKTDNGITVHRDFDTGVVSVYVTKVKFKHIGKTGYQDFFYDLENGRYWIGGQDKTNWIAESTVQSELPMNTDFLTQTNHDDSPFPF